MFRSGVWLIVFLFVAAEAEAQDRRGSVPRGSPRSGRSYQRRSPAPRSYARRSYTPRTHTARTSRSYTRRSYTPRTYTPRSSRSYRSQSRSPIRSHAPRTYSSRSSTSRRTPTASPSRSTARSTFSRIPGRTPTASRSRSSTVRRTSRTGFSTYRTPRATSSRARTGVSRSATTRYGGGLYSRYGYRSRSRSHRRHGLFLHSYYPHHGLHLSFSFGFGRYHGCSYYYPYYHYATANHYAFFYPYPVTYCYAPFGFYLETTPIYVTRHVTYVRDDYDADEYETAQPEEQAKAGEAEQGKQVEPEPAADSPVTEKFLRDGSDAFHKADYKKAAEKFRLAAVAAPDNPAPLFALGQALIALEKDDYASRVLRRAFTLSADLVKEPGDIVGVYKDQAEFDRVLDALESRAKAGAPGSDARFLLGVQRYFSGDPRARDSFKALAKALPEDAIVKLFVTSVEKRFKGAEDLPPIK